jgi:OOP family OmpA-OmpF porin
MADTAQVTTQRPFTRKEFGLAIACALALGVFSESANSQVAAAAAPLPIYEKVVFDATVLFDSDKSALRPAGRDTLDEFVARIHGLDSRRIVAIGYADRMGSHDANQALSRQRVDAVKAYLVGKGIRAERVEASARGETRPTTSAGECKDANNAKNVACMQPDRHVFVEVSGTRIAK